MVSLLGQIGRHGRFYLIAGLFVGLLAPGLSETLRPWIGEFVAVLLLVTGIRVGAHQAFGARSDLAPTLRRIGFFQTVLPLIVIALLGIAGLAQYPIAMAVSPMLAAPSLTGAPNFAIMIGEEPVPGMRILVMGTALFPFTALPVFLVLDPTGGGAISGITLSMGLMFAILISVGFGFLIRHLFPNLGSARAQSALDGCSALLLAVVVIGLMSAIGPLLRSGPMTLLLWMLAALSINFVLVVTTLKLFSKMDFQLPIATAIFAGNRNIALFLIVLPDEVAAPLMIFVGCYQIPMYLTPFLLTRFKT